MKQFIILSAACMFVSAATHAQKKDSTLVRTVVVENEYNPDIMNASKINIVPTVEEPKAVKKNIEYANTAHPSNNFGFHPMGSFGTDPAKPDAYRGYARAGYGNYGNVDAKLYYRFDLSKKDRLDLSGTFSGMKGELDAPYFYAPDYKWDARYYTSQAQAGWEHDFSNLTLGVNGKIESQVFNYLDNEYMQNTDKQHNTLGELHVNLGSTNKEATIRFTAGTGIMYAQQKYSDIGSSYSETRLHTTGLVTGDIGDNGEISIGAKIDNFFYTNKYSYSKIKDYTSIELNPAYQVYGEQWKLRLGVHVDLQTDNGNSLQVAPDVTGEYSFTKGYTLYAQATGGRQLNDFRHMNALYPYCAYFQPNYSKDLFQKKNTYTQVDARVGFRAAPVNELHLHVFGGFRSLKDELFNIAGYATDVVSLVDYCEQDDATDLYAGAAIQYTYKNLFSTNLSGTWHRWDSDGLLWMHPEMELSWAVDITLIKNLQLNLGYKYVQRCKDKISESTWDNEESRVKAINNLSAGISYRLIPALGIWVKGDNLLNKTYSYYAAYPSEKLNFMAGVSFAF